MIPTCTGINCHDCHSKYSSATTNLVKIVLCTDLKINQ